MDVRVLDPSETRGVSNVETIHDPALAGWLLGADLASSTGLENFTLFRPRIESSRAWLMPAQGLKEADGMANPLVLLERFRGATPLPSKSATPERAEVEVTVADPAPSMVVLSKTFDPEWQAWWSSDSVERRPATVEKILGGWQGVAVPEPGRWTLHLEYPGREVRIGLIVSILAWSVWLVVFFRLNGKRIEIEPEGSS